MDACQLCTEVGGKQIYRNDLFRVVLVNDVSYPGFIRLIVNQHVKEMSDLSIEDSYSVFAALFKIETVIKKLYKPDKINLASLGNVVPHVHWHIIPRYNNDKHFPNPIWGEITNASYIPDHLILGLEQKLISQLSNILSTK